MERLGAFALAENPKDCSMLVASPGTPSQELAAPTGALLLQSAVITVQSHGVCHGLQVHVNEPREPRELQTRRMQGCSLLLLSVSFQWCQDQGKEPQSVEDHWYC